MTRLQSPWSLEAAWPTASAWPGLSGGGIRTPSFGSVPSPAFTPEEEASLLRQIAGEGARITTSGLAAAGNILDLPSSMLRDVGATLVSGELHNPLDQLLTPFSHVNRVPGRDLLTMANVTDPNKETGIGGWVDDPMEAVRDIAGFGLEVGLDIPGFALAGKALKAAAPLARAAGKTAAGTRLGGLTADVGARALTPVADYGIAAFDKSVMGGLGSVGRELGRRTTRARELGGVEAREAAADVAEEWGRYWHGLESVPDAKVTPQMRLTANNLVTNALETGDIHPLVAPLSGTIQKMRDTLDFLPAFEKENGLIPKVLQTAHDTRYAKRELFSFGKKPTAAGLKGSAVSARHGSQIARRDFLRNLEGITNPADNTHTINKLSTDKALSGVVHGMQPSKLTPEFWKQQRQLVEDTITAKGNNADYEDLDELTKWLAHLPEEHARTGIPVFPNDPVRMFQKRVELDMEAAQMGKAARDMMVSRPGMLFQAGQEPITAASAREAFENAGFAARQQIKLLRQEAGMPDLADLVKGVGIPDDVARVYADEGADAGLQALKAAGFDKRVTKGLHEAAEQTLRKNELYIPKELAENMSRIAKVFSEPDEVAKGIFSALGGFTKVWKHGVLGWPAYHVRNRMGGAFANFLDGALSKRAEINTERLLDGKAMQLGDDWQKLGKEFSGLSDKEATRLFAHQAYADNVAPRTQGQALHDAPQQGILRRDLPDDLVRSPSAVMPGVQPLNIRMAAKEAMIPLKPLVTGKNIAAEWTEGMNRVSPYLERRLQGMSREQARLQTRLTQVNYNDLTNFERQYIRPMIPFYGFTKGMTKKVATELMEHPGLNITGGKVTGRMSTAIRAQAAGADQDKPLPEHLEQTGAIPIGTQEDGTRSFITGLGLMHEDPLSFLGSGLQGAGTELASRMHPLAKFPAEAISGESFFQRGPLGGRELVEMDPPIGRLLTNLGLREELPDQRAKPFINRTFEHLMSNLPSSRAVTTLRTLTDERKRLGDTPLPGPKSLLNVLSGVRITDLSPASADRALREKMQALALEELSGKTFRDAYVPQDLREHARVNDPQQFQRMEALRLLGNSIDRRNRERRMMRDLERQRASWTSTP